MTGAVDGAERAPQAALVSPKPMRALSPVVVVVTLVTIWLGVPALATAATFFLRALLSGSQEVPSTT